MKTVIISLFITFPIAFLVIFFSGGSEPGTVAASIILVAGYLALREIESAKRLQYCRTPEAVAWLTAEHLKNYQVFTIGLTMALLVVTLVRGNVGLFAIMSLLAAHHLYSLVLWRMEERAGNSAAFTPLALKSLGGFEYKLPAWRSLSKKLRVRLLHEAYGTVPASGETHLYLHEGLFHTKVHIVSTDGNTPCLEGIPAKLLKELEKYPVRESRLARWSDRVHLIAHSPVTTAD